MGVGMGMTLEELDAIEARHEAEVRRLQAELEGMTKARNTAWAELRDAEADHDRLQAERDALQAACMGALQALDGQEDEVSRGAVEDLMAALGLAALESMPAPDVLTGDPTEEPDAAGLLHRMLGPKSGRPLSSRPLRALPPGHVAVRKELLERFVAMLACNGCESEYCGHWCTHCDRHVDRNGDAVAELRALLARGER